MTGYPAGAPVAGLTVLVGPPGAGKTTLGALLANRTGRVLVDADEVAAASYARLGWSTERLRRRAQQVGFERAHAQFEPALAAAVVDLVDELGRHEQDGPGGPGRRGAVLALGAGHTHLVDPALFAVVAAALARTEQVIALRPHPDPQVSLGVLRARCAADKGHDWRTDGVDWLARWLGDGRDEQVATAVVHTGVGVGLDATAQQGSGGLTAAVVVAVEALVALAPTSRGAQPLVVGPPADGAPVGGSQRISTPTPPSNGSPR